MDPARFHIFIVFGANLFVVVGDLFVVVCGILKPIGAYDTFGGGHALFRMGYLLRTAQ